jgi:hypothetical protein
MGAGFAPGAGLEPAVQIIVQGSVYGVDDLVRTIDLALKRQGSTGLVTA